MPESERTIAKLYRSEAGGGSTFLGTAFAFRHRGAFLTAAHCVHSSDLADVRVVSPQLNQGRPSPVSSIVPHDSADVAVVKVEGVSAPLLKPFFILSNRHGPGTEIEAWGFPLDFSTQGDELVPTRRVYAGTVQQTLEYKGGRYNYTAGEVDFTSPEGLSGRPVCTRPQRMHLAGLMTGDHETSTLRRHSMEEVDEDGDPRRVEVQKVIAHGLFVDLAPLARWLEREAGGELR